MLSLRATNCERRPDRTAGPWTHSLSGVLSRPTPWSPVPGCGRTGVLRGAVLPLRRQRLSGKAREGHRGQPDLTGQPAQVVSRLGPTAARASPTGPSSKDPHPAVSTPPWAWTCGAGSPARCPPATPRWGAGEQGDRAPWDGASWAATKDTPLRREHRRRASERFLPGCLRTRVLPGRRRCARTWTSGQGRKHTGSEDGCGRRRTEVGGPERRRPRGLRGGGGTVCFPRGGGARARCCRAHGVGALLPGSVARPGPCAVSDASANTASPGKRTWPCPTHLPPTGSVSHLTTLGAVTKRKAENCQQPPMSP